MSYDDHDRCRRCGAPDDGHSRDMCDSRNAARAQRRPAPANDLPRLTRRSDGKVFRITLQARSPDGSVSLLADDGPPFERVETTSDRLVVDFIDPRDVSPPPRAPTPIDDNAVLSYGSDNAGGVHLCLGNARIHLSAEAVTDLAAGLMAEASRPPSTDRKPPC